MAPLLASTQAGYKPLAIRSSQKLHFSTTPLDRVGYSGLVGSLMNCPGISPVKTPGPVRTAGHTEPAADTAVIIHHDDSVGPFKGGLGGTDPDTGGIGAVIAKHQKRFVFHPFGQKLILIVRKGVFVLFLPDPLDLLADIGPLWGYYGSYYRHQHSAGNLPRF